MGVSGSGKTTIGAELARRLGLPFAEADELHPSANIAKMTAGDPLTDGDRWPWLQATRDWMSDQNSAGRSTVVTCSALRRTYRDVLREADSDVFFIHLEGDPDLIGERLHQRTDHFMPPELLPSQFQALEPLDDDEDGVTVSVAAPPDRVIECILHEVGLRRGVSAYREPAEPPRRVGDDEPPQDRQLFHDPPADLKRSDDHDVAGQHDRDQSGDRWIMRVLREIPATPALPVRL
jgi:gluconokinase